MNDDNLMFEYLLQMGAMRPEELEMMRKQKVIDELRNTEMPQGQMVGKHYVAPHWSQQLGAVAKQIGGAYQQKKLDDQMKDFNTRQGSMLDEMRRRRLGMDEYGI